VGKEKPSGRVWGAGRVAVLALADTIRRELAAGHPLSEIYRRNQAAIPLTYERFRQLVTRYVGPVRDAAKSRDRNENDD